MTQDAAPVICDGCLRDISSTGNCVDYCLRLQSYSPPPWYRLAGQGGGVVTAMMIYPVIKADHHFCNNLECVGAFLDGPDAVEKRKREREKRQGGYRAA